MRRMKVDSSAVRSVGYDEERRTLEVEFENGGVYRYADVPPEEVVALLEADSIGRYMNKHIKSHYSAERVS